MNNYIWSPTDVFNKRIDLLHDEIRIYRDRLKELGVDYKELLPKADKVVFKQNGNILEKHINGTLSLKIEKIGWDEYIEHFNDGRRERVVQSEVS